jgi:hypothetical protein
VKMSKSAGVTMVNTEDLVKGVYIVKIGKTSFKFSKK